MQINKKTVHVIIPMRMQNITCWIVHYMSRFFIHYMLSILLVAKRFLMANQDYRLRKTVNCFTRLHQNDKTFYLINTETKLINLIHFRSTLPDKTFLFSILCLLLIFYPPLFLLFSFFLLYKSGIFKCLSVFPFTAKCKSLLPSIFSNFVYEG